MPLRPREKELVFVFFNSVMIAVNKWAITVVFVCLAAKTSAVRKIAVGFTTTPKRVKKILQPPPPLIRVPRSIS